jgi:DNA-binding MarR family transcriptional regulator
MRDVPEQLGQEEKAAYWALMRVVFAVPREIGADISCASGLGLSDYVVLEALLEAPDCQLRAGELAAACGVSISGATRILNRLEREGLMRRVRNRGDARGIVVVLTAAGRAGLERVHAAHLASVRRHIFDHLSDVDMSRFTSSMERIADSLQESMAYRNLGYRSHGKRSESLEAVPD